MKLPLNDPAFTGFHEARGWDHPIMDKARQAAADTERLDWLERHANFIEVGGADIPASRDGIDEARARKP